MLDTSQVAVAAGSAVMSAPAGTAYPTLATAPAAPWKDLGYISDDGVTHTFSRDSENFGAWQTLAPILVLVTGITDTFGFAFRQWNLDTFTFVYGSGGATPPQFEPSKAGAADTALLLRWDWLAYKAQLWVPRGKLQGDTEDVLTRTAPSDLPVELVSTPSGTEPLWRFETTHPAFSGTELFAGEGEGETEAQVGEAPSEEAAA